MNKPLQILSEKYVQMHQESASSPEIDAIGNKIWRNANGQYHRLDGPTYIGADGHKEWWINGERHRLDGPAVEWADGSKDWYIDGKRHRIDGPAVEHTDGRKGWWVNGKLHRLDGPAIEWANGKKQWWIDDIHYTEKDFNKYIKGLKARQDVLNKDNPGIEMDI